ncbi:hypothetical protein MGE_01842 [Candida albicans P75010]|nr:hypothetical protein MGE_01842 [Candida albicans P75010]
MAMSANTDQKFIRTADYDFIQKLGINVYYPSYIENPQISGGELKDLIIDKPIYKEANKHAKKRSELKKLKREQRRESSQMKHDQKSQLKEAKRQSHLERKELKKELHQQKAEMKREQYQQRADKRAENRLQKSDSLKQSYCGHYMKQGLSMNSQIDPKNDNYPQPTSNNNYSNNNNNNNYPQPTNYSNYPQPTSYNNYPQPNSYSNYKNLFDVSNSDTTDDEKTEVESDMESTIRSLQSTTLATTVNHSVAYNHKDEHQSKMARANSYDQTKSTFTSLRSNIKNKLKFRTHRSSSEQLGMYYYYFSFINWLT